MLRPCLQAFLIIGVFLGIPVQDMSAQPPENKAKPLFNGVNFAGWYKYSGDKRVNAEELIMMDPFEKHIIIKGTSPGYLITDKMYSNYELNFEWRWALSKDKAVPNPSVPQQRKSGVLAHIAAEGDLIWPKSLQSNLNFGRAGDLYVINGFKLNVKPERIDPEDKKHALRSHDGVERQIGEWNQGTITCHGKFFSFAVNGTMVVAGRDAQVSSGRIALQSEAGEIHFRKITMRPLEGKPIDPEKDD